MEISDVLREFIRLCNVDIGVLQHHLAANSVLEWFGRTIRDRAAVYTYYRYDLCQQFEHCFEEAVQCPPIESKPTHMQTKQLLSVDLISTTPSSTLDTSNECITPAQNIITTTLPKVIRDKRFIDRTPSPPAVNATNIEPTSHDGPALKRFKYSDGTGGGDNAEISNELNTTKYLGEKKCDIDQMKPHEIGQGDCNIPAQSNTLLYGSTNNSGYTELMYLESVGILLTRSQTKHRGITGIQSQTETPYSSTNNDLTTNSLRERKSKLKISYRIRLHDNHIQFALIIYEHLSRNPITRRNLLMEFDETDDTDRDSKKTNKYSPTIFTPPPKRSLKRSLRL